ncbi:hypothetical protein D9M71_152680 [compost metagenome]
MGHGQPATAHGQTQQGHVVRSEIEGRNQRADDAGSGHQRHRGRALHRTQQHGQQKAQGQNRQTGGAQHVGDHGTDSGVHQHLTEYATGTGNQDHHGHAGQGRADHIGHLSTAPAPTRTQ